MREAVWRHWQAYEVKSLSLHHRFVIALHSPDRVAGTGLRTCHRRKGPEKSRSRLEWILSLVRFDCETCGIAAIFSDLAGMQPDFSAAQDSVADREGLEPLVPLLVGSPLTEEHKEVSRFREVFGL